METICLVKDQVLCFPGEQQTKEMDFLVRKSDNDLITELPRQFCASVAGAQPIWNRNLEVKIMLPEAISLEGGVVGIMQLEADREDHVLQQILDSLSLEDVTLTWKVTNFGNHIKNSNDTVDQASWVVEGIDINQTRRLKTLDNGNPSHARAYLCVKNFDNIPSTMIAAWKNKMKFSGTFSVLLSISKSLVSYELAIKHNHLSNCRKMLEECVGTDIVLLTSVNKIPIPCHTGMLSVSSDKFARLLSLQNGRKQVCFMRHLSTNCVQKLLAYVYHADVKCVGISISFALEVLEAAMEFRLLGLVLHLEIYLAEKSSADFNANEAVKLFVLAKSGLEDNDADGNGESEIDDDDNSNSGTYNGTEGTDYDEDEIADDHENSDDDYDNTDDDNGKTVEQTRRGMKRTYDQDYNQRKRNCVGYKGIRVPVCSDNVPGCSTGTIMVTNGNRIGSADSDDITQNNGTGIGDNLNDTNGITMDDVFKYRDLLEKQAIKNILWQLKNNRPGLLECSEYLDLVNRPHLLLEITNIFAKSSE